MSIYLNIQFRGWGEVWPTSHYASMVMCVDYGLAHDMFRFVKYVYIRI
jgi:hypothetical protein